MPFSISYSVRDEEEQSTAWFTIHVPDTLTVSNTIEFAIEMAELFQAVMTGRISGITIGLPVDIPPGAVSDTSSPGSDLQEGAKFIFETSAGPGTSFRVPTFNESLMVPGTDDVDVSLPSVAAMIAAMEDGLTLLDTSTAEPVGPREEEIITLRSAYESFSKYRN